MDEMKNVLLVTNTVNEEEISLIKEALTKANVNGMKIKLSLAHVIPNLPTCYFNIPSMVTLAEQYYEEAKKTLNTIGDLLEVSKKNQWLITGRIKTEVLRLAYKLDIQFILASSSNIQDIHKSIPLKKEYRSPAVRNINHINTL
jgi:hypothetical protein